MQQQTNDSILNAKRKTSSNTMNDLQTLRMSQCKFKSVTLQTVRYTDNLNVNDVAVCVDRCQRCEANTYK